MRCIQGAKAVSADCKPERMIELAGACALAADDAQVHERFAVHHDHAVVSRIADEELFSMDDSMEWRVELVGAVARAWPADVPSPFQRGPRAEQGYPMIRAVHDKQ